MLNDPPWKGYNRSRHVELNAEPVRIASSILHSGEFANPFATMPTGPTAHAAPGLPFLQFAILRLFGDGSAGWLGLRFLPSLALSLQFALLPWLAREMGFTWWTGVLASVFGLAAKAGLEERWEAHIAGLLSLLLTASACRWQVGRRSGTWAIVTGAIAALAIYVQPVMGATYGVWVLWSARPLGFLSRRVLPLWLIPLALAVPWIARGYAVLGGLFPLRDNLGIEMYVSFNDCAPYSFRANMRNSCIERFHPNSSVDEALAIRTMGEYRYNQDRLQKALSWISGHPGQATGLVLRRIWFFWFPSDDGWQGYLEQRVRMLALDVLTLLSFAGLYLYLKRGLKRGPVGGPFILLWIALYPLIYYAIQFEFRYRYPILWTTWLLAAWAIVELIRLIRRPLDLHQGLAGFGGHV